MYILDISEKQGLNKTLGYLDLKSTGYKKNAHKSQKNTDKKNVKIKTCFLRQQLCDKITYKEFF